MATACYTADYLPASFKGVPFDCMEAASEHGRRGAEGEFPFGEDTAYADLGRRIRTYTLKARFVENDHIVASDALIAACEATGPGTLVHPTRGLVMAACKSCKVSDDLLEEQGVTYVDLEFVEANEVGGGMAFGESFFGLDIGPIVDLAGDVFGELYDLAAVPFFQQIMVTAVDGLIINTIADIYETATYRSGNNQTYAALSDLRTIANDSTLLMNEDNVRRSIVLGISAVSKVTSGSTKFEALRRIANSAAGTDRLRGEAATAVSAVRTLTRVIAAAFMAQTVMEITYATVGAAYSDFDVVSSILAEEDRIAYDTCQNTLFLGLRSFEATAQAAMFRRTTDLPSLVEYNFSGSVHPLVAAYSIFGDAKRHRELERGNVVNGMGRFAPIVVGASQ